MGFQVKAWLRRKTVMLGSKGGRKERERSVQLHLALLPGVVRRVHRLQNQLWPSLRLTREGSARHGVSRPGAAPLGQAAQG